eukprot:TRINITY_DN20847_c0_g1_i2.p1 TRINITY_DN20847_c0_g1~~TRINITY_DN20847_c0_g1_i2.p1  ORF type:complete len:119 (+),score=18.41 TRINITY_DN20847_c0_g1_i2:384-740(+)
MLKNEKRIVIIKAFESKVVSALSLKVGSEFDNEIAKLQKEYSAYMQKHKYGNQMKKRQSSHYQQVVGEMESILSPQHTVVGKSYSGKQRNKSLYYIKRKQTFLSVSYTHLTLPTICSV